MTQRERIESMERILDKACAAVRSASQAMDDLRALEPQVRRLAAYYNGGQWLRDYEDDEAGRLPQGMKRGVLSQDAVHDLLSAYTALTGASLSAPAQEKGADIYVFSGPCGVGKSTLADAYAAHLANACGRRQAYVIHGDDFHAGFVQTGERVGPDCPQFMYWEDILRFNWACILSTARQALSRGVDVVIDYVVEDELPLLVQLAREYGAGLHYVVLTASQEAIRQRLTARGDTDLIPRALFLKDKLEAEPANQGHILDNTALDPQQTVAAMRMEAYLVPLP
ncbi:MAG: DUF4298 domain-containing protein [Clostridia bacterium]|nr:DUF4298 domain-containing protein [Clostridia bacterium]